MYDLKRFFIIKIPDCHIINELANIDTPKKAICRNLEPTGRHLRPQAGIEGGGGFIYLSGVLLDLLHAHPHSTQRCHSRRGNDLPAAACREIRPLRGSLTCGKETLGFDWLPTIW